MKRFVREKVIEENSTPYKLIKLDLRKEETLLPPESVNVGFGAKRFFRLLKTTGKTEERKFRLEARGFLSCLIEKLLERYPLKYKIRRPISSLSPVEIAKKNVF